MKKFQIQVFRKKDIGNDNIQYYSPVSVKELKSYGYNLIVNTKDGFISCNNVVYDNLLQSTKDFIMNHPDLVNSVLGID